jgi:hypothetical protein
MTRSADRWIKSTTIGCERAREALRRQVQAHRAVSPVQRRVKQTRRGYLGKRIAPMLGERPIGGTGIEHLGGNAAEVCKWRGHGGGQPQRPQLDPPGISHAEPARAERAANRDLLTLKLVHLGASVRRMRTLADPDDLDALQQLMLDVARRGGGDRSCSGESEMNLRLSGSAETIATVVAA